MAGGESFEVQVLRQGRWMTESARDRQDEARQLAQKFLSDKKCEGARVVASKVGRDGLISEKVIFEQSQTGGGDGPARINPIDSCPPRCQQTRDYFGLESRMTINRILRTYLEDNFLTPTELLHVFKEIQRVWDKDNLIPSAADRIASLQTKIGGPQSANERREEIYASLDQIQARAREATKAKLPTIGQRFSDTLNALGRGQDGETEYRAIVALARELVGLRNWMGKLDRLTELAAAETDAESILLLDTVIADVLGANVVQELLGWQPSLASAIISLLDLGDGKFDHTKSEAKGVAERLVRLFAQNKLPGSRHVLVDRALRHLRSSNPLSRNDPKRELEEYQRVLLRLLVPGGIISGAEAAEALTLRGTRFVEQGGATGKRAAIQATVKALPDRAHGVMYLSELTKTDFAKEHQADIIKQLDLVFGARVIGELCRRTLSPKERLINATGAFNAALASALPDLIKRKVADHIDDVLERYLIDENIIEKLDDPKAHLRDRAIRLVKFCGAGVLPQGKALNRARMRVIKLLRQPSFDSHFIEGIADKTQAEKALRDFHHLLIEAGFG